MAHDPVSAAGGDATRATMGIVGSIVALAVAALSSGIYMLSNQEQSKPTTPIPETAISTPAPTTPATEPAPAPVEKATPTEKSKKLKPPPPDPG